MSYIDRIPRGPVFALLMVLLPVLAILTANVWASGIPGIRLGIPTGGGGSSASGNLAITGTVGQPVVAVSSGGNLTVKSGFWQGQSGPVSAVDDDLPEVPLVNRLNAPYPNPFNPSTTISFELSAPSRVSVRIFDAKGQRVRDLVEGQYAAGNHEFRWDGKNSQGGNAPSGVYFVRFQAGGTAASRKMTLLK